MANVEAWGSVTAHPDEGYVGELFRARYLEMVRLAGLLGADDPEDVAQEAFTRLMNKAPDLDGAAPALAYLRAIVVNLTRNRHRHLRVARLRGPAAARCARTRRTSRPARTPGRGSGPGAWHLADGEECRGSGRGAGYWYRWRPRRPWWPSCSLRWG
jgi:DNA-directed RNA polymerase specialized sigma24 family protein